MQNSSLCAVLFYSCQTNHDQTEHGIQQDLWILVLNQDLIELLPSRIFIFPISTLLWTCNLHNLHRHYQCKLCWRRLKCDHALNNKPPYKSKKIHKHRGREWLWGMKQCPWFLKHCWKFWYVGECAPSPSLFIFQTCCKWVTVLKR